MSERNLKIGLLGAGYIIDAHAKALRSMGMEITAVCDQSRTRAQKAAEKFGIRSVFTSLDELLATDVDVIHILLPPHLHAITARRVLESGCHVFLEKPMGLSSTECGELMAVAKTMHVSLGVNHNFVFLPGYEALRSDVRDGTLGPLDQVTIHWLYTLGLIQSGPFDNWILQAPGNLFFELGPHMLSFVIDLLGPVDVLNTHVSRPIDVPGGKRVYRHWQVQAVTGDTAIDLNLSVSPGATERTVRVRGQAATATYDFDRDLYFLDEPSGHGVLLDNFARPLRIACDLAAGATRNFVKATVATLTKSPAANPFTESVALSVRAFYSTLEGKPDARLDAQFGVNVIRACEDIAHKATFQPAHNRADAWATLPPLKEPTVLVLGGTGFIGKHLVRALSDHGLGVRVATRNMNGGQLALAGIPVELVIGDISDPGFMRQALTGIRYVYHLAKADGQSWEDYRTQDVLTCENVARCALAAGVKRFIYTGTIDSYYSGDENEVIASDTPLDPRIETRNHYARAKATCEALLNRLHKEEGLPLVVLRPGIVIGLGCPPAHWGIGMFQSPTRMQYWGSGKNKLPLVLVDDVVNALVLALEKEAIEGQTFLVTDDPLLTARDYVEIVSTESGTKMRAEPTPIWRFYLVDLFKEAAKHAIRHRNRRRPSYRDWDSRSHRARYDSSKTKVTLGWKPAGNKKDLIERGIIPAVRDAAR
jgi:predicted dehydrogenase/nucleoside-diphosphate-sugar epimerase